MEQKHYICTGDCHGESKTPGTCQATTCQKHGQPLTECGCADGKHQQPAESPAPKQEA